MQVVPHVTDEIKSRIYGLGGPDVDVVISEVGGTVGDIEGLPFMEAVRQMRHEVGPGREKQRGRRIAGGDRPARFEHMRRILPKLLGVECCHQQPSAGKCCHVSRRGQPWILKRRIEIAG